ARLGLVWVGTLSPRTTVVYRGHRQAVRDLASRLKLPWRSHLNVRAVAVRGYAPAGGAGPLVGVKNEHGNFEYLGTNAPATRPTGRRSWRASGAAGASRPSSATPNNWRGWGPASAGWIKLWYDMSRSCS